jgi:GTP1/Obg family GTP-binding protein
MRIKTAITALGLAGALMTGSMTVSAQQNADFSESELNQFVEAQTEVMEIRNEYVQRIESTEDREEAMALEQEGNEMMVEAVEETGLSVDTYSSIAQAASDNPDLAERIQSMMN